MNNILNQDMTIEKIFHMVYNILYVPSNFNQVQRMNTGQIYGRTEFIYGIQSYSGDARRGYFVA